MRPRPGGSVPAELDLGPIRHLRDVLVVEIKRDADYTPSFRRFDGELRLQRRREDANGVPIVVGGGVSGGIRVMVEGGLGEIGDGDEEGLARAGLTDGGVEGEEDGLEAGEGGGGGGGG